MDLNGTEAIVVKLLGYLGAAALGSFLAPYLSKKAENRAIDEDLKKLVKQMEAVTSTTEEIKAKISDEVWARQRRWEVQRDAVFEALKELASVEQALRLVLVSWQEFGLEPNRSDHVKVQSTLMQKHQDARVAFARAKVLASVACGKQVRDQFDVVGEIMDVAAKRAAAGNIAGAWDKLREYWPAIGVLLEMVRNDLGVYRKPEAAPLPAGYSAAPDPDLPTPK